MAQLARNPNKSNDLRAGKSIIRNDGQPEKEHEVTRREEVEKEKEEEKEGGGRGGGRISGRKIGTKINVAWWDKKR
ncbi:hypothetical protein V1477_018271 [Vespula maculifrons]|uniref:Uncharacterized protein n=1 Tax=Vespula maculifrons TaxID=7453 RepID=A0ABD2AYY8_VESMC